MKPDPHTFSRRSCGPRGLEISHLGLGGAPLGRPPERDGVSPEEGDESGARTLEAAYALGVRHVDTSPAYGQSERRIGIALARNDFDDLTLSTKVGTHPERRFSYAADDIRWSLENSLQLFGREYVDVALIHDPPSMDPVLASGDGFDALAHLREEGLCRNIGLGVHSHAFHRQAIDTGAVDVILTYGDFNIVRRNGLSLMRYAKEYGVGVLLGSPMMHGVLAIDQEPMKQLEARPALLNWYPQSDIEHAQEWWEWCREREVSMRHLNMHYVMSCDYADCILSGSRNSDEMETNVCEARETVPDEIWSEALVRIDEIEDAQGSAAL
jgi:aryl-alcohol dehydrogenase-like predicted oxidoreductase